MRIVRALCGARALNYLHHTLLLTQATDHWLEVLVSLRQVIHFVPVTSVMVMYKAAHRQPEDLHQSTLIKQRLVRIWPVGHASLSIAHVGPRPWKRELISAKLAAVCDN